MKRAFLIALFCFLSVLSFGQKIRFTDAGNVWTYVYSHYVSWGVIKQGFGTSRYSTYDTTISGHTYKIIINTPYAYFIREDTNANKVFIRNYNNSVIADLDTSERILYDYNAKVGDTVISVTNTWELVTSIDSVQINAIWYKVWHIKCTHVSYDYYYNVIEGIGCTSNFDFPASYPPPPYTGPAAQLLCFFNNGTKPLLSGSILAYGLDNSITIYFDNNADCTLGVVEITQKKDNTNTLFPNPIDETSKIALPYNIPSGKITVCNDIGQTIFSNSFQNKEDILIGDKIHTPGMYFYLVIDNQSGSVFSGKFICR